MINLLFVCTGNICRSPMAEAVFKDLAAKAGLSDQFSIGSAGTDSYHVGDPAHPGTRRILAQHGISCQSTSQLVSRAGLNRADYIIAMDRYNLSDLRAMIPRAAQAGRLHLLLSFADGNGPKAGPLDVPDPYYSGNFEEVYQLVRAGCQGLLAHIRQERGI